MRTKEIFYITSILIFTSCVRKLDKTNAINHWEIENYEIAYFNRIGPVGPDYYEYDVYKNGYFITNGFIQDKDTCKLRMKENNDHYIVFNLCKLTKKDLYPKEIELNKEKIDSILLQSKKSTELKKLTKRQIEIFTKDWNKSNVLDLRDYKSWDSTFYPNYKYKIWLYGKNKDLEFIASSHMIADKTQWVREISEYKDGEYFDNLLEK